MLKVSFEFDEVTQKVSNVKVETVTAVTAKDFDLQLDDNKLILTASAVSKLGAVAGDRLSINY